MHCKTITILLRTRVRGHFVMSIIRNHESHYVYIIDQARGQDGWILAEFSFCVFMDRDEVEVHKIAKRERGQYPAILTGLAWSNDLRTCLFSSTKKETS